MNCYYSNLIEGHNTHPVDIQRALYFGEKSGDPKKRDLQQEAIAHIAVQRWIDEDGRGNLSEVALVDFTRFFLNSCLDQIDFMEGLMRPDELRARIMGWADDEI